MAFFFGGGASVDLASPSAIGSTTPNTGKFTTLNISTNGSAPSSALLFSGSGSVNAGFYYSSPAIIVSHYNNPQIALDENSLVRVRNLGAFCFSNNSSPLGTLDTYIYRDSAGVLAQRNSTNAQTFRLYNTFTDASNYERGFMQWATNVLEIGAEAAGTGTQRTLVLKVGSTDAVTITTTGQANFSSRVQASNFSIGGNFIYADTISNGFRFVDGSGSTSSSGGLFLYNAYTNTTNNERGFVRWGSNRFQVGTISIGTGTARSAEITFYTSASDPTSSDITSGYFSVWKNSGTGTIKLWANDGGTMKSVALA